MRHLVFAAALLVGTAAFVPACDDDDGGGAPVVDGGPDAPVRMDATDAPGPAAAIGCLDRPDELPRPPAGRLPCDLIPPGLRL